MKSYQVKSGLFLFSIKATEINENNKYLHFVRQACRQQKLLKMKIIIIIIVIIITIYSLNIAPLDIKMIKSARGRSKIV